MYTHEWPTDDLYIPTPITLVRCKQDNLRRHSFFSQFLQLRVIDNFANIRMFN